MEKDITIKHFIQKMNGLIESKILEVVDYWEADLCAIGLKRGNRLVYISTYNYIQDKEIRYDFDFEIINEFPEEKINVTKVGRGVLEGELISELNTFLMV